MLTVEGLQVTLGSREILRGVDMEIKEGEVHILFGPNGSGKTSLLMTLMGYPQYRVTSGKIVFKGIDITRMPVHERAQLGMGMSYQRPPTIHGLKTRDMISICTKDKGRNVEALATQVNMGDFLDRDLNAGFSGGEIKRSELLQLMAQNPDLMLFDEPESGVDMENIALIGNTIGALLERNCPGHNGACRKHAHPGRKKMGLIITHTGYILNYVPADRGQVLFEGVIACRGNPQEIFQTISRSGYQECIQCMK
jgi:Fe-S cluster assembly ATP-binding protein